MSSLPSVKTASKLALPATPAKPVLYSITNRCGLCSSAVKTPFPEGRVSRSSQKSSSDLPSIRDGRQAFAHHRLPSVKLTSPFELMSASVKDWL
jgi:hypothetical protein